MKIFWLFVSFFCLSFTACKFNQTNSAPRGLVMGETYEGEYRWPNATASLCWEPEGLKALFKRLGRDIEIVPGGQVPLNTPIARWEKVIAQEYGKSVFKFQLNRSICKEDSKGIRMLLADQSNRYVVNFGYSLDGVKNGVTVNGSFADSTTFSQCRRSEEALDRCILHDILHELGHGIGLAHEASRHDSPCIKDSPLPPANGVAVGPYDANSIMNYCGNERMFELDAVGLSEGDIETINQYYTKAEDFMVEDSRTSCLEDGNRWDSAMNCCNTTAMVRTLGRARYASCPKNVLVSLPDAPMPKMKDSVKKDDEKPEIYEVKGASVALFCLLDGKVFQRSHMTKDFQTHPDSIDLSDLVFKARQVKDLKCYQANVEIAYQSGGSGLMDFKNYTIKYPKGVALSFAEKTSLRGSWQSVSSTDSFNDQDALPTGQVFATTMAVWLKEPKPGYVPFDMECREPDSKAVVFTSAFFALPAEKDDEKGRYFSTGLLTNVGYRHKKFHCYQITFRPRNGSGKPYAEAIDRDLIHDGKPKQWGGVNP